jgi:dTDP-4-dehydrorhamnose reductase
MPDRKPLTVLQFGETGQVARELARQDWGADCRVEVFGRAAADFTNPQSAAEIVDQATDAGMVINAAAYTAVDKAESDKPAAMTVNADAVGALARACAARSIPLIHLSTDYIFDGRSSSPYRESAPPNPINVYGLSKLAGEDQIREGLAHHVILRTSWVYSPYGANFLKTMLRLGIARDELRVVNDQVGTPTAAADIAGAIHAIVRRLQTAPSAHLFGTFHYTAMGRASWFDFAAAIMAEGRKFYPVKARLEPIPASQYPTPAARPANSQLDCSKIETVYDIMRQPWENGMRDAIARLAQEGGVP